MTTRKRTPRVIAFSPTAELAMASEMTFKTPCLKCKNPLDLHQPDLTKPERLLGICPNCHSWMLVDESNNQPRLTLILGPE
jgi:hypothetical protein